MNIGLLTEHLDPARGGLEVWSLLYAGWLASRGHRVHALAFDCDPSALPPGVEYHAIAPGRTRIASAAAFAAAAERLSLDLTHDLGVGFGADVLHPLYGSRVVCAEAEFGVLPAWTRRRKRLSPAWRRRRRAMTRFELLQMRSARGLVVVPSRFAAGMLVERYGLAPSSLHVVYNGVDPARFQRETLEPLRETARAELGLRPDHMVFLQVAVNFRLKGVATVIQAMPRLPPHVHYVVAGQGPIDAFAEEANRLGVGGRVHFTGGLLDVRPVFAAADAYVHPTWHDACSLSVIEGWAAGLPAITTPRNGAAELLTHGEQGFVLEDPGDAARLGDWMNALLDEHLRREMGAKARALAAQNSFERQFAAIADLYRECPAGSARPGTGRLMATPSRTS